MRPTQCVGELYLTVADSLAPLPNDSNNDNMQQIYVPNSLIFWRIQKNLRGMQMVVHDELKIMSYELMCTWILV